MAAGILRSARVLAKSPGFVFASLLAIILGVSASTVVFSLINAVLIHSVPYGNADRLVYLWTPLPSATGLPRELPPFYSDLTAWRKLSHSFTDIAAMQRFVAFLNGEKPLRIGPQEFPAISSEHSMLGPSWGAQAARTTTIPRNRW